MSDDERVPLPGEIHDALRNMSRTPEASTWEDAPRTDDDRRIVNLDPQVHRRLKRFAEQKHGGDVDQALREIVGLTPPPVEDGPPPKPATMSADVIARVVSDVRRGSFQEVGDLHADQLEQATKVASLAGPTVDCTTIYASLVAKPQKSMYDHLCIAPPWKAAALGYATDNGRAVVISLWASELDDADRAYVASDLETSRARGSQPGPWAPPGAIDWMRVRWLVDAYVFVGGARFDRTTGPFQFWKLAIYDDGIPADLHQAKLATPAAEAGLAHMVLLAALNFCNCSNVELVEPKRPRAEAKRIARTGVRVSTINVFPAGRRSAAARIAAGEGGVPLSPVRGTFHHYGPEYGRGLLFGKYSGRFWIPPHARGDKELGEVRGNYVLRAEENSDAD